MKKYLILSGIFLFLSAYGPGVGYHPKKGHPKEGLVLTDIPPLDLEKNYAKWDPEETYKYQGFQQLQHIQAPIGESHQVVDSDSQQALPYMSIADVEKVEVGNFYPIQDSASFLARYDKADETNFLDIIKMSSSRLKERSIDIGKLFHYGKRNTNKPGYSNRNISYRHITPHELPRRPIQDCYLLGNDGTTHLQIYSVHEIREDVKLQMIACYCFADPLLVFVYTAKFIKTSNKSALCKVIANSNRIQIKDQRLLSIPEDSLPQTHPGAWATTASSSQGRQSSSGAAVSEREDDAESVASTWGSLPNAARSLEYYVPRKVKRNSALPRQATPSIWAPAASVIDDDVASASGTEYSFPDTERSLQYYERVNSSSALPRQAPPGIWAPATSVRDDVASASGTEYSFPDTELSLQYYVPRKVKRNSALPRQTPPGIWAPG